VLRGIPHGRDLLVCHGNSGDRGEQGSASTPAHELVDPWHVAYARQVTFNSLSGK